MLSNSELNSLCPTIDREKRKWLLKQGHDIFVEVWDIAGVKERSCWEVFGLAAPYTTVGDGKHSVPSNRARIAFPFLQMVFSLLCFALVICRWHMTMYNLTYLKIECGVAANVKVLLYSWCQPWENQRFSFNGCQTWCALWTAPKEYMSVCLSNCSALQERGAVKY